MGNIRPAFRHLQFEAENQVLQNVLQCFNIFNSRRDFALPSTALMFTAAAKFTATYFTAFLLTVIAFYLSLLTTSLPTAPYNRAAIDRAIEVLEQKGFDREVFLLRKTATFRSTDHWLNTLIFKENAYAATNFPVQIVTIYPDFYYKAVDDTERAMVLLHEAQHLQGKNEAEAYAYVWKNRARLGWTLQTHGTTPSYVTIELQTRENAPELFTCYDRQWKDCTE